jgi:hypothetical protein
METTLTTNFCLRKKQKTKGKEEDKKQAQWLAYTAGL